MFLIFNVSIFVSFFLAGMGFAPRPAQEFHFPRNSFLHEVVLFLFPSWALPHPTCHVRHAKTSLAIPLRVIRRAACPSLLQTLLCCAVPCCTVREFVPLECYRIGTPNQGLGRSFVLLARSAGDCSLVRLGTPICCQPSQCCLRASQQKRRKILS